MNIFGAVFLIFLFFMASALFGAVCTAKFGALKRERVFLSIVTLILVVVLGFVIIKQMTKKPPRYYDAWGAVIEEQVDLLVLDSLGYLQKDN